MEVGRPTLDLTKSPIVVGRPTFEDDIRARAHRGCREVVRGCSDGVVLGVQQGSSPPVPFTKELTEEALLEEASKHTVPLSRSFFLLGKRDFFSFSTLSRRDGMFVGTNGGCGRGCSSKIVGEADLGPLRIIMANGREAELSGLLGSANGTGEVEIEDVMERVPQEITKEGNAVGESCWQSNCLAKFS